MEFYATIISYVQQISRVGNSKTYGQNVSEDQLEVHFFCKLWWESFLITSYTHRIHVSIFTYIHLVVFNGFHVGNYTSHMDPKGKWMEYILLTQIVSF